ncbi:MAG TPA: cyclic nucleotide-binding domain-containing protein [Candidatus Dormibacteraeota bacterium]|nr:cyclic nucleotide-binding domain-containing protein [Candidatus Dormibacteraeota bacterium]
MAKHTRNFNPKIFLSTVGKGREMTAFRKGQMIFAQGDLADAVFVIQTGMVRLSARSQGGKEATLDILGDDDFVGKDSIDCRSVYAHDFRHRTDRLPPPTN